MQTKEIVLAIKDYFENTILFLPNLTASGLGQPTQLEKNPRLDFVNDVPEGKDVRFFEVASLDQAAEIIGQILPHSNADEVKKYLDEFVIKNKVDTTRTMYLVPFFYHSTE